MYRLEHQKPLNFSNEDLAKLVPELEKLNYNITVAELQKIARKRNSVFFIDTKSNVLKGYAEIQVKGKRATIDWLFAPRFGKVAIAAIVEHLNEHHSTVDTLDLIVELDKDETDAEKMSKARLNLYFDCGFRIQSIKIIKNVFVFVLMQSLPRDPAVVNQV
jgi:hypothetical protein